MRKIIEYQMKFWEVAIESIEFDLKSRDEITKLLIGIQSIYFDKQTRIEAFAILNELTPKDVDCNNGRKGMDLWKIFVLGMLKLNTDIDFDKLHELANNHKNVRLMLGHSILDWDHLYALQTIRDNVSLFTPEILDKLNQVFISYGHKIVGKKAEEGLKLSCDSAVNKTDVHYPTDINLLWDAMRKTIILIMALTDNLGLKGWREGISSLRKIKQAFRRAQQMRQSKSSKNDDALKIAHLCYLELAETIIAKSKESISFIISDSILVHLKIDEILEFIGHAERQIDQIQRRVIEGETIPHHEKVFSIFEEHTEWISKGKAGVPVELGL